MCGLCHGSWNFFECTYGEGNETLKHTILGMETI